MKNLKILYHHRIKVITIELETKWTTMCHCKREHSLCWWAKCVWGKKSKYRKKILCSGLVDYVENQCVYHIYHSNISGKKCTLNVYRTLLHLIMQNVKNSGRLLAQSCSVHQEIGSARSWIRSSLWTNHSGVCLEVDRVQKKYRWVNNLG